MTLSLHCCGTFPLRQMRGIIVVGAPLRQSGLVVFQVPTVPLEGRPISLLSRLLLFFYRCGNLLFRGLGPDGIRDELLRAPLWSFEIKLVKFHVRQRAEELHPSLENTSFISHQASFVRHGCSVT